MDDKQMPAPPKAAPKAPGYLVALGDAPGVRAGQVVPNTQENAKALEGKCRAATDADLGVAGVMRKV